jgi:glycerol transport system substrate-binding protein
VPGYGEIAQTIYFCGTFCSYDNYHQPGSPVCDAEGNPKWRLAPQPHGKYWEEGMKVGYQDAGSWTIPVNVTGKERAAAWLWAQFCVSKSVCLKKFLVGSTPIRKSTVFHPIFDDPAVTRAWGGLIEFYRSPDRKLFTDTGLNVPDYPLLQGQWWQYISKAASGELTPMQAMKSLAERQDELMAGLQHLPVLAPRLAPAGNPIDWLKQDGAPKMPREGRGAAKTIAYEALLAQWKAQELR